MELIVISKDELRSLISEEIKKALNIKANEKTLPDRMDVDEAINFLNELRYPIGHSKLYKWTASKKIPHKLFGNRLIFSRAELKEWVNDEEKAPIAPVIIVNQNSKRPAKRKISKKE